MNQVKYPEAWEIHNWNGIIFGDDDLLTLDATVGIGDEPEQPDED